jgi:XTP/dITP diphosphohydrolase
VISLLAATRNTHKAREIQGILGPDFHVHDLSDYPHIPETIESGKTFEENAVSKALAVSEKCDDLVLADDSGLEVDALGGAPGVVSARYAGNDATDLRNIEKLRNELAKTGDVRRSARFRCVIALARGNKILDTFAGAVEGRIIDTPRGNDGFGYDPIFVPDGFSETFGELPAETKNQISHRAKALAALRAALSRPRE